MEDRQRSPLFDRIFAAPQKNHHAVRLFQQCHTHYSVGQNSGGTRTLGIVPVCSGDVAIPTAVPVFVGIKTGKFLEPGAGAAPFVQNAEKNL